MGTFTNKTLLITGGTGSFGNAVLNRFLDTDIKEIRIFSRDEKKQDDMRHEYQARMPEASQKIKFFIGDVRDLASVKNAMHGVDYIFHAAALKQVPSCEFFPVEAVKTNVLGTENVLTAAIEEGVQSVICLSTDKAAYPVNAMGTSKAMMEKVIVAKSRTVAPERTKICCTRYGNVMCSRGSVIPLCIDQIKAGNPITITEPRMTRFIKNKTLLITGGTGSFGNAVLNRFLETEIKEIRIFSRDEKKQDDMRHEYQARMPEASQKIKFFIGDVRDLASVKNAMHGVDYIFHAAALKQVPSCEFFPVEAVKTNVLGTENVLTAAIEEGVQSVICLSTDKAAYPVNAMGTSKAMMEKVIVAKSRTVDTEQTKICCTRYGNVMCSRGSVIPLWIDQIKAGNPITITEPRMTRFIMSLEEAVDLVLFAFEHGTSGDILVQKAPACTIETLAKAVTSLFAPTHEIKMIGIRHGEKMYETLLTNEECAHAVDLGDFYRVPCDKRDLNYDKYFKTGDTERNPLTEFNSNNTELLNVEQVKEKLLSLSYIRDELAAWEEEKA